MSGLHLALRYLIVVFVALTLAACAVTEATPLPQSQPSVRATPASTPKANHAFLPGRLLYVESGNLFVYQNGSATQLTDDGDVFSPAWSPDGEQIAVVQREESYSNILLLDPGGEAMHRVTDIENTSPSRSREAVHEVVWTDAPAWTPDGEALVYTSQLLPARGEQDNPPLYEYPLSIFEYRLGLLSERPASADDVLIHSQGPDFQQPAWAPDGTWLAYVRVPREAEAQRQIMLFDPENEESQSYPGIPADSYDPVWSPDGRWLAFTAVVDGQTDVWVIDRPARSTAPVRLTTLGQARAAAWSPDGESLAYINIDQNGSNLYVLTLETDENGVWRAGDSVQLTTSGNVDANSRASWTE